MARNSILIPEAKAALDRFKKETADEAGVTINQDYNGEIATKHAGEKGGKIGGQMVKKMIQSFESNLR